MIEKTRTIMDMSYIINHNGIMTPLMVGCANNDHNKDRNLMREGVVREGGSEGGKEVGRERDERMGGWANGWASMGTGEGRTGWRACGRTGEVRNGARAGGRTDARRDRQTESARASACEERIEGKKDIEIEINREREPKRDESGSESASPRDVS